MALLASDLCPHSNRWRGRLKKVSIQKIEQCEEEGSKWGSHSYIRETSDNTDVPSSPRSLYVLGKRSGVLGGVRLIIPFIPDSKFSP
jgi:hypothetical protein